MPTAGLVRAYERIIERCEPGEGGCLIWPGATGGGGYGNIWVGDGQWLNTHRAVWIANHGPVPNGLVVCHACDNPPCCNSDHLFLGTQAANIADKHAKQRHAHGPALSAAIRAGWTPELRQMRAAQTRRRATEQREARATAAGVPTDWKWCAACQTWKARSEYQRNAARHDGLKSKCKPCATVESRLAQQRRRF